MSVSERYFHQDDVARLAKDNDRLRAALGNAYDVMCAIYALESLSNEGKKMLKDAGEDARRALEGK